MTPYCPQATVNDLPWTQSPWLSSWYLWRSWTLSSTSPLTSSTHQQRRFTPRISCSLNLIEIFPFLLFFCTNSRPGSNPTSTVVGISVAFVLICIKRNNSFLSCVECFVPLPYSSYWNLAFLSPGLTLIYLFNSYNSCHCLVRAQ